jgi:hypothetical protein
MLDASPCRAQDGIDLTGAWTTPDRDHHWSVRQVGSEVWWVSMSKDDGKTFMASGHGTIIGKELIGTFADVPLGKNRAAGSVRLNLIVEGGRVVRMTGRLNFGGGAPLDITIRRHRPRKE